MNKQSIKTLVTIPFEQVDPNTPIDPYGKKQGSQSFAQIIKRIGDTPAQDLKNIYGRTLDILEQCGNMPLRELAVIQAYFETIEHPNPSMLNWLAERSEGKVPQMQLTATGNIGDWMEYAKEQGIAIEDVMAEAQKVLQEYNEPPKVVEGEIVE